METGSGGNDSIGHKTKDSGTRLWIKNSKEMLEVRNASACDRYQERITENKNIMEDAIYCANEQPRLKGIAEKVTKFDFGKGSLFLARLWD